MPIKTVLIVDDELLIRNFLTETLKGKNLDIVAVESGKKAFKAMKEKEFDLVFTEMKLSDMTGIDFLRKLKELSLQVPVIVITAFGSIENAVEAMHLGAFSYLIKPFSPDTIEATLEKAAAHVPNTREHTSSTAVESPQGKVIGKSAAMQQILSDVERVASSNASVFIHGESGTGKEVIAQAIHDHSLRKQCPFIKVNCAAVPETLIESEFFGHEKGAFTGANQRRLGRFELAHTGTLLLDEVTEVPLPLQAKLLRVIQEQEFERVGGTKPVNVDVRLISTTNRDIHQAIEEKRLREDLYYRLNVVTIPIPPLRERPEDILPLAKYFLEEMSRNNHKELKTLSSQAEKKLLAYTWPGNVRELANSIERSVVMGEGDTIAPDHLLLEPSGQSSTPQLHGLPVGMTLKELEKRLIIETLQVQKNNRTKTAKILGISVRTLRNKLQEYEQDGQLLS